MRLEYSLSQLLKMIKKLVLLDFFLKSTLKEFWQIFYSISLMKVLNNIKIAKPSTNQLNLRRNKIINYSLYFNLLTTSMMISVNFKALSLKWTHRGSHNWSHHLLPKINHYKQSISSNLQWTSISKLSFLLKALHLHSRMMINISSQAINIKTQSKR